MKSKTSFFNPTIFRKNCMLYMPIWVVYTAILIILVPVLLWLRIQNFYKNIFPDYDMGEYQYYLLEQVFDVRAHMYLIFIFSVIIGMAIYSYMYNAKSANMIHALPVTRFELYGTSVITGLLFMWVPQIVSFVIVSLVALYNGITAFGAMGMWLLIVMALSFFSFSMVTFCAQFTGQIFALPIYFGALNILFIVIRLLINQIISELAFGISNSWVRSKWDVLSPIMYLDRYVRAEINNVSDRVEGIEYSGERIILLYAVVAVFLFIAAFFAYKFRKIESAGDLLTFKFVKPIFRWGVGICFGFSGAFLGISVLRESGIIINIRIILVITLIIGWLFFSVAEMFIAKKVKIYNKKLLSEMAFFTLAVGMIFGGLNIYSNRLEGQIPSIDMIDSVSIEDLIIVEYEGVDITKAVELQKMILDKEESLREESDSINFDTINFKYKLKDGSEYRRSYGISYKTEGLKIHKKVLKEEQNADVILQNIFGYKYDKYREFISGGYFEYYLGAEEDIVQAKEINKELSEQLYQATVKDAKSGNLLRAIAVDNGNYYNLFDDTDAIETGYFTVNLLVKDLKEFTSMDARFNDVDIWGYEDYSYTDQANAQTNREEIYGVSVCFSNECVNIIECLKKNGLIE